MDKFDLQYGIEKVIIEIDVSKMKHDGVKGNNFSDHLEETLENITGFIHNIDWLPSSLPNGITDEGEEWRIITEGYGV